MATVSSGELTKIAFWTFVIFTVVGAILYAPYGIVCFAVIGLVVGVILAMSYSAILSGKVFEVWKVFKIPGKIYQRKRGGNGDGGG